MDPITMGIIAGASQFGGQLLQYQSARETNRSNETMANNATAANMQEAATNRTFQDEQASREMAFQERMSNTAHQREVEDLRKAGLNPILAMNSGSSTPSGAQGSGSQGSAAVSRNENPMSGINPASIITSALEGAQMLQGLEKQSAETKYINAQTKKVGVDTSVAEKDIPKSDLINKAYKKIQQMFNWSDKGSDKQPAVRWNKQKNDFEIGNNPSLQWRKH